MAVVTVTQAMDAKGAFKVFNLADVDDGETLTVGTAYPVKNWWYQATGNPGTQASAGGNVTFEASTGVFTFYPGESNMAGFLFVVQSGL